MKVQTSLKGGMWRASLWGGVILLVATLAAVPPSNADSDAGVCNGELGTCSVRESVGRIDFAGTCVGVRALRADGGGEPRRGLAERSSPGARAAREFSEQEQGMGVRAQRDDAPSGSAISGGICTPASFTAVVEVAHRGSRLCIGRIATIVGTRGADRLRGTSGPDVIMGLGGKDVIDGRGGDDRICGGPGADTITGGRGADGIEGGKGRDTIRGNSGRDVIDGGSGRDRIYGGGGSDFIFGSGGNDLLVGGRGNDLLDGGAGNDKLRGKSGNDTLRGGSGSDSCKGGRGRDTRSGCAQPRSPAPTPRPVPPTPAPTVLGTYQITISGSVSGNAFLRFGTLRILAPLASLTDNDVNPIDFCITSGNPLASPQTGALRWGTSVGCLSSGSQPFDLAYVSFDGRRIIARPDPNIAAVSTAGFNARGGIFAQLYFVIGGSIVVDVANGSVAGSIEILGFCGICTGGVGGPTGTYSATFAS